MKKLLGIALGVLLAGCAATGVQVKEEQLTGFEKGQTTIQEVTDKLGPPTNSTLNSDGARTIMYIYASSTMRPETFIPYIGAFVGGSDTKTTMVSFNFDQSGVLTDYSSSQSQMGLGMGFAAKTKIDQERTSQPQPTE